MQGESIINKFLTSAVVTCKYIDEKTESQNLYFTFHSKLLNQFL